MKKIALLFLLISVRGLAWCQDDGVDANPVRQYQFRLDTTSILIGEQTTLIVDRPADNGYPTLDDLSNNGIVAVRQWLDTASSAMHIALTCFDEGEHYLHIGADSVLLVVNDVEGVDTASVEIRDIAGIMRQPYTFWEIFRWVLLAIAIAALAVAAVYAYRRFKQRKPIIVKPQAPPVPPDVRALNNLELLRQKQLWQAGKVKDYHTELTDIVRAFLEEAYGIPSAEMTSDQTLDAYHACAAYDDEAERQLRLVLQTADMVKFAKSEPLPFQHDQSLAGAIQFVKSAAKVSEASNQPTSNVQN